MSKRNVVRVAGGEYKGRKLRYPDGRATRPTMQRTKESLFDSLGGLVDGAVFVDLFAGAGGVGIEALSRGAAFVHFVEHDRGALDHLRANLDLCGVEPGHYAVYDDRCELILSLPESPLADARVLFADPPYGYDLGTILARLAPPGFPRLEMVIVEHDKRSELDVPAGLSIERTRAHGETVLCYLLPKENA